GPPSGRVARGTGPGSPLDAARTALSLLAEDGHPFGCHAWAVALARATAPRNPAGENARLDPVTPAGAPDAARRAFALEASQAPLGDLRRRIDATQWPERETVADASQGVQLATTRALARYWATEYDWRACEARLKALPQFITEIDGLDIHFAHVRS